MSRNYWYIYSYAIYNIICRYINDAHIHITDRHSHISDAHSHIYIMNICTISDEYSHIYLTKRRKKNNKPNLDEHSSIYLMNIRTYI